MEPSLDLAGCYQTLRLPTDATEQEIKLAYRQLARRYHPDVNPGNPVAEARFKQVALAYRTLLAALQRSQVPHRQNHSAQHRAATAPPVHAGSGRVRIQHLDQTVPPNRSPEDRELKRGTLNQLSILIKRHKWQQAIGLAESLAVRFPGDPEVSQGQTLAYHHWARNLLERKQYEQARAYLKKALQSDPHNRQLWAEIEHDYQRMERQLKL